MEKKRGMRLVEKSGYSLGNNLHYMARLIRRQDKGMFVLLALGALTGVALSLAGAYLPKLTLQGILEGWDAPRLIGGIGALALVMGVCGYAQAHAGVAYQLRSDMVRLSQITEIQKAALVCDYGVLESPKKRTMLNEAMEVCANGSPSGGFYGFVDAVRAALAAALNMLAFGILLILGLSPAVVLVTFACAALSAFLNGRVARYEHDHREQWTPIDKKLHYVQDSVTQTRFGKDVRLYQCQDWLAARMDELVIARLVQYKRVLLRYLGADGVGMLGRLLRDGVTMGYLISMALSGALAAPDLLLYLSSASQLSDSVGALFDAVNRLNRCHLKLCAMRAFMDLPDVQPDGRGEAPPRSALPPWIEFKDVSFRYEEDGEDILKNISFTLRSGEKLALVGGNGAGKTTLVKLMCGFYKPTQGQVLLNGTPIERFNREKLFALYSTVFQDMTILPLTVGENVSMRVRQESDMDKVAGCLERAGLAGRFESLDALLVKASHPEAQDLSGGEAQKLLLSRALYKDAPILILDEPTAALDPLAESRMYEQYSQFTQGKTSLFISHRLSSTRFCDRILYMEHGEILESGSHDQLMAAGGGYAHLFEVQSQYYKEEGQSHEQAV